MSDVCLNKVCSGLTDSIPLASQSKLYRIHCIHCVHLACPLHLWYFLLEMCLQIGFWLRDMLCAFCVFKVPVIPRPSCLTNYGFVYWLLEAGDKIVTRITPCWWNIQPLCMCSILPPQGSNRTSQLSRFVILNARRRSSWKAILYFTILDYILVYSAALYCTIPYAILGYSHSIMCCTVLCYSILHYTILHHTILYQTIPYDTILYSTTILDTTLCCPMLY